MLMAFECMNAGGNGLIRLLLLVMLTVAGLSNVDKCQLSMLIKEAVWWSVVVNVMSGRRAATDEGVDVDDDVG